MVRIGKLELGWDATITAALDAGIEPLPRQPEETAIYGELNGSPNNDPFDRILIWQAIQRNKILVSNDPEFKIFKSDGLKLLWK